MTTLEETPGRASFSRKTRQYENDENNLHRKTQIALSNTIWSKVSQGTAYRRPAIPRLRNKFRCQKPLHTILCHAEPTLSKQHLHTWAACVWQNKSPNASIISSLELQILFQNMARNHISRYSVSRPASSVMTTLPSKENHCARHYTAESAPRRSS